VLTKQYYVRVSQGNYSPSSTKESVIVAHLARPPIFAAGRLLSQLGSLSGVHLLGAGCLCLTIHSPPFPYSSVCVSFLLLKLPHLLYALLQQSYPQVREKGTPTHTDDSLRFIEGFRAGSILLYGSVSVQDAVGRSLFSALTRVAACCARVGVGMVSTNDNLAGFRTYSAGPPALADEEDRSCVAPRIVDARSH
jgi:hypothetical protein